MLSEQDITKIAEKVLELQEKEGIKAIRGKCSIADITDKYHKQMYEKFGTTGTIEAAIRTVAVYKTGTRYISQIPEKKFEECRSYAEKIYKDILYEGEQNVS